MLELQEPRASLGASVTLTTEGSVPRPISLVPGHTYYIMCRDTDNTRRFDDNDEFEAWHHDGTPVQKLSPEGFPTGDMSAVYASRDVSPAVNEWTLVLQRFGGVAVGVYRCTGVEGESLSLNIGQGKG